LGCAYSWRKARDTLRQTKAILRARSITRQNRIAVALALLSAVIVPPWLIPWLGTDVAVRSSDGHWSDSEVLIKGRRFDDLVFLFELYRINCNAPAATLQRTSPWPRPWSREWWFDTRFERKWRVPFVADDRANTTVVSSDCSPGSSTADSDQLAHLRAKAFLQSL
jgi:hypothetical protein